MSPVSACRAVLPKFRRAHLLGARIAAMEALQMATRLTITPEFIAGRAETLSRDWPGWDPEVTAPAMRGRAHVLGGGLAYVAPLERRHREAGIASASGEWIDPDRAAFGAVS